MVSRTDPLTSCYIVGPPSAVEQAVSVLVPALAKLGCEENFVKTLVWGPGTSCVRSEPSLFPTLSFLALVEFSPDSGLLVLGVPIHPPGRGSSPSFANPGSSSGSCGGV